MKDKNGKPVGILSHIVKTHVSESNTSDMISTLNKDLSDIRINDQISNEDILSYTNPKVQTNKQTILSDSIDVSTNKENFKIDKNDKENLTISSISNTNDTNLMD